MQMKDDIHFDSHKIHVIYGFQLNGTCEEESEFKCVLDLLSSLDSSL